MKKTLLILTVLALGFGVYFLWPKEPQTMAGYVGDTAGLVGWWTFDTRDMNNGVAFDSSNNGNNGNVMNIASSTFYTIGEVRQGFLFDGVNDYFVVADPASGILDFGTVTSFTLSAWIKTSTASNNARVFEKGLDAGSTGYDMQLWSGTGGMICGLGATDNAYFQYYGGNVTDNKFHIVTCTFDQTAKLARQYVDGVIQNITKLGGTCGSVDNNTTFNWAACTTVNASNGTSLSIGRNGIAGSEYFTGTIDDVRIYSRVLSSQENTDLYRYGLSKHLR